MKYFHFTLGPVQSFVSQARRTRDFWGGSFLLSWLSAVAMKSVQVQTGSSDCIQFPEADQNFLDFLSGKQTGKKPTKGSVPNRFKAEVANDFNPHTVVGSVQAAWEALAKLIYDNDLKQYVKEDTQAIWDRQIGQFWDISWVLAVDKSDNAALDKRKNWRIYMPPDEAGVKCMMMDGWQELSGTESPDKDVLQKFWDPIQNSMQSDLREHEYLCAIAFVKRRFVRHFNKLKDYEMPGDWLLSGWTLPTGMPSVAYMAGVHWLEKSIEHAEEAEFQDFFEQAYKLTGDLGEWDSRITCLQKFKDKPQFKKWTSLDGNVFHPTVLENVNIYPDQTQARHVDNALKKLNDTVKEKHEGFMAASPFYAVLMMDGDSLGKHMCDQDKQKKITKRLKQFTDEVQGYVEKHNGFLIYAGGDDVLALLPLEDALQCAADLRMYYLKCFKGTDIPTTLSGAIEYAHIKTPLTKILFDAHHLLDDIAKEQTGRDSIAVRVQKPGGLALEWSMPWDAALDNDKVMVNVIADQFQKEQEADDGFSSKFFYKIRERFSFLNPVVDRDGKTLHVLNHDKEEHLDLMCMEYLNSGKTTVTTMSDARKRIEPLLKQCSRVQRIEGEIKPEPYLFADGALLVRFLAQKGMER